MSKLTFSLKERFESIKNFAPLSWGCPSFTLAAVDKNVFKKSDEEKSLLATLKSKLPKTRIYKFTTFLKQNY